MDQKAFANLPPEVWASIVIHIPGEDLGRLKLTGAIHLWRKLIAKGTVSSIKLGMAGLNFKRWPAFLNEFPCITKLVISNDNRDWWDDWKPNLSMVPKSLRKLKILMDEDETPNFFLNRDGSASSVSQQVPQLEELAMNIIWSDLFPWLADMPESLTKLKLSTWVCLLPLPRTIHHLNISNGIFTGQYPCAYEFPPELKTFTYMSYLCLDHGLPSTLHTLHISGAPISSTDLSLLPPRLTELSISLYPETDDSVDQFIFPVALERLCATRLPSKSWSRLPDTLKSLHLFQVDVSNLEPLLPLSTARNSHVTRGKTAPIHFLPQSITQLAIDFDFDEKLVFIPDDGHSRIFPNSLTHLQIPRTQISEEAAKKLPPSLTLLTIGYLDGIIARYLPSGVTKLQAENVLMSADLIKFLPRSLKHLVLTEVSDETNWMDPKTGTIVKAKTMKHDAVPSDNLLWSGDYCLPPSLNYCELEYFKDLKENFALQNFPKMETLNVLDSPHFTDKVMPHLSRCMMTLIIPQSSLITGQSFASLPRTLTHLNLARSRNVVDQDVQHLPRRMETLILSSAVLLTNLCLKDLPQTLSYLNLDENTHISPDSVLDLPLHLRSQTVYESFTCASWMIRSGEVELIC